MGKLLFTDNALYRFLDKYTYSSKYDQSKFVILNVCYTLLFALSLLLSDFFKGDQAYGFWFPAAGLRFTFILFFGWRFGFTCTLSEWVARPLAGKDLDWFGDPFTISASIIILPIIHTLIIELFKRLKLIDLSFSNFSHIAWLCGAIVLTSATSSLACTLIVTGTPLVSDEIFWLSVIQFWFGDMVGILMVTPIAIAILVPRFSDKDKPKTIIAPLNHLNRKQFYFELLLSFFVGLFLILVTQFLLGGVRWLPLLLPISWLSIRYGFSGAAVSVFILILAIGISLMLDSKIASHLSISFFLPIMSILALLLGALASSRKVLTLKLQEQLVLIAHQDRLKSLGEMASILAHELTQPLSLIRLNLLRVQKSLQNKDIETTSSIVSKTEQEINRMEKVISRIRDFSRNRRSDKEITDFSRILLEIIPLIELEAQRTTLNIEYDLNHEKTELFVDVIQIQQCILNLVRNASQSIHELDKNDHKITISSDICKNTFEIVITDTGAGISPEIEEWMFKTYNSSNADHIGLGLPICQSIMREHGGTVSYESVPGYGSSFKLNLPLARN